MRYFLHINSLTPKYKTGQLTLRFIGWCKASRSFILPEKLMRKQPFIRCRSRLAFLSVCHLLKIKKWGVKNEPKAVFKGHSRGYPLDLKDMLRSDPHGVE